jgi:predicted cation transporter
MMHATTVDIGLFATILVVLIGPFSNKSIERNLEAFLFVMGLFAVTIAGAWDFKLVVEAVKEPVVKGIVPAVLVAGLLFHYGRSHAERAMDNLLERIPLKLVVSAIVVGLGLGSSIITAIIASLLLVELVNILPLERSARINVIIIACFSIGLGAALTPLGEPLSTIAITKLQGAPYHAGFFFLFDQLAWYIIPGILAMGLLSLFFTGKRSASKQADAPETGESLKDVGIRALKVYLFVMALILLGGGMKVIIDKYFSAVSSKILFWLNMVSAILDNATLTAAEIAPSLHIDQITAALMGLLISGGMLIPGNIPNIISANKLGITSKEWARLGVPVGLIAMLLYFVWLFYLPFHPTFRL